MRNNQKESTTFEHRVRHTSLLNILRMGMVMVAGILVGCSGRFVGQPREELLNYQIHQTQGSLYELAEAYGTALNSAIKADTLHPGMYADYGVTLAMMGHKSEACRMFNAEMKAFPQSRPIINKLKMRLMPDMMADTLTTTHDTANLVQLSGWAYDSAASLIKLAFVPSIIDSTDTVRIKQQNPVDSVYYPLKLTATQKRELLYQEQHRAEQLKQAHNDSVAAAKQAKIEERKQAKKERLKAKKEKEKAQKQANKQKKRDAKAKAKQRDAERKQKAAERQAQRKAAQTQSKSTPTTDTTQTTTKP